jgi:uncharacterized damage-inducible protein DinB
MTVNDLETLYDYSYWANARLFPVVSALTTEEFVKRVAGSWGSVRNTLVHMMSAEGGWLERAGGPKRGAALQPDDFPTLPHVVGYWAAQERNVRRFIGGMTDAELARVKEFTIPPLSLTGVLTIGEMLHHAVNHNIHHRAQAVLQIRELGYVPGNVDLLFYYGERRDALA